MKSVIIIILVLLLLGIIKTMSDKDLQKESTPTELSLAKSRAELELRDLLKTARDGDIISDYDLSQSIFYAGKNWYRIKASMKKDLVAKIAMLKKSSSGFSHLEIRDAYSNEMVAEVSAFSQDLEIYK